jgi:hypothetical protein
MVIHVRNVLATSFIASLLNYTTCRSMAQAIIHQPPSTEPQLRARISPSEICSGQSGTGIGFQFSCQYHSTVALHTRISHGEWTTVPSVAAVQRHSLTTSRWTTCNSYTTCCIIVTFRSSDSAAINVYFKYYGNTLYKIISKEKYNNNIERTHQSHNYINSVEKKSSSSERNSRRLFKIVFAF